MTSIWPLTTACHLQSYILLTSACQLYIRLTTWHTFSIWFTSDICLTSFIRYPLHFVPNLVSDIRLITAIYLAFICQLLVVWHLTCLIWYLSDNRFISKSRYSWHLTSVWSDMFHYILLSVSTLPFDCYPIFDWHLKFVSCLTIDIHLTSDIWHPFDDCHLTIIWQPIVGWHLPTVGQLSLDIYLEFICQISFHIHLTPVIWQNFDSHSVFLS